MLPSSQMTSLTMIGTKTLTHQLSTQKPQLFYPLPKTSPIETNLILPHRLPSSATHSLTHLSKSSAPSLGKQNFRQRHEISKTSPVETNLLSSSQTARSSEKLIQIAKSSHTPLSILSIPKTCRQTRRYANVNTSGPLRTNRSPQPSLFYIHQMNTTVQQLGGILLGALPTLILFYSMHLQLRVMFVGPVSKPALDQAEATQLIDGFPMRLN